MYAGKCINKTSPLPAACVYVQVHVFVCIPAMPCSSPHTLKMLFLMMLWKQMVKMEVKATALRSRIPVARKMAAAFQNPLAISLNVSA